MHATTPSPSSCGRPRPPRAPRGDRAHPARGARAAGEHVPASSRARRGCGPTDRRSPCCPTPSTGRRPSRGRSRELAGDVHRAAGASRRARRRPRRRRRGHLGQLRELLTVLLAAEAVGHLRAHQPGACPPEHAAELVRLSGRRVIVAAGPELERRVWALARRLAAADRRARAARAAADRRRRARRPQLEPLEGIDGRVLSERIAPKQTTVRLPGAPPRPGRRRELPAHGRDDRHAEARGAHAPQRGRQRMDDRLRRRPRRGRRRVRRAAAVPHQRAVRHALAPLLRGQHVVWAGPLGYRDPSLFGNFWKIVERYRIAVDVRGADGLRGARAAPVDADISSLRLPIVGAAPLPAAVARRLRGPHRRRAVRGLRAHRGDVRQRAQLARRRARRARSASGCPTRRRRAVADRRGAPVSGPSCPDGEVGTLVAPRPQRVRGLPRPRPGRPRPSCARAARSATAGSTPATSARSTPTGYIRLAGRAKDLIIRGGHNIDPADDRGRAARAPGRHAAAARSAGPTRTPARCRSRSSRSRRRRSVRRPSCAPGRQTHVPERAAAPKHVEIVDDIPLTAVGKPFKPELRRRAAEAAARDALAGIATDVAARLAGGQVVVTVRGGDRAAVRDALAPFAFDWETADQERNR